MSVNLAGDGGRTERWDQLYAALSAQPRRMVIFSLLDEPEDRWLSLPEAAYSSTQSVRSRRARIRLRHHHLPALADPGYVRWESEPFRVRRGSRFEEPAFVVRKMIESSHAYPERLRDECTVIGGPDQ